MPHEEPERGPGAAETARPSPSDRREIVIQAGLELIPHVGGSLAAIWSGVKQQRRLARIEFVLRDTAARVKEMEGKIRQPEEHDAEALAAIIEELLDKAEREQSEAKLALLRNYLVKTLTDPVVSANYERRRFFLRALAEMNSLDCEVLAYLYKKNDVVAVGSLEKPGIDAYEFAGTVGRLKSFGFLKTDMRGFRISPVDHQLTEMVSLSDFGRAFCEFCLEDAGGPDGAIQE